MRILIGHRGTGKSELAQRMMSYLPGLKIFDLDHEIAARVSEPVKSFIEREGIRAFRKLEIEVFEEISRQHRSDPMAVAVLGAGFEGQIPEDITPLWVRRLTDQRAKAFVNRPRLGKNYRASQDYLDSQKMRQQRFKKWSSGNELILQEGIFSHSEEEEKYFRSELKFKNKLITLVPENFLNRHFAEWVRERLSWGLFFEFRSDLLTEAQWLITQELVPEDALLYSVRKGKTYESAMSAYWVDVEIEDLPNTHQSLAVKILSAHQRHAGEDLSDFFSRLESKGQGLLLKAAPEIHSFAELKTGHEWALKNKHRHVFLPRTPAASRNPSMWRWYRQLRAHRQSFGFLREGDGSSLDQPTLMEVASLPERFDGFAAVLGESVEHSFSPRFHAEFFKKYRMPYLAIPIARGENFNEALNFLSELGMRAASITAPYKKEAGLYAGRTLGANTLVRDRKGEWHAEWTDPHALKTMSERVSSHQSVAIWGAGVMSELLQGFIPQATVFSARTGKCLRGKPQARFDLLIWAAGSAMENWPDFTALKVLDLDYSAFSVGLDFAVSHRLDYESGWTVFQEQGRLQQKYWQELL